MSQNWLQHALRRSPWRPQRQVIALGALVLFVAIIVGALYLAQASATSTMGRQLDDLIAQRDQLEQQNEEFRAQIASLRTEARLQSRAQALGFASAAREDIEYLVVQGYNPDRVQNLPTPQAQQPAAPLYDETFMGWVQQQWDILKQQFNSFVNREEAP
jgi:cell division protein FtsB